MRTLWLDTETYSEVPIKHGTYKYASNCEVDIISYAWDDAPVSVLDVANGPRSDVLYFESQLKDADIVVAHNAMFDRNALRLGNLKIEIPIHKWRCSMVRAMAHGLPGSLDKLGGILGVDQDHRKLREGKALMMLFCKPRPKNSKIRRATKHTHPAEWERYLEYARVDVEAMRASCKQLPEWNYTFDLPGLDRPRDKELALWHLDQAINDQGFEVDTVLVREALRAVDEEQARLKVATREATGYDGLGQGLGSATQRDAMLAYLLEAHGVLLADLRSSTLEKLLDDDTLEPEVQELLRLRLQVSSTSTSKYKSLARGVTDGRMCGTIQFDGASRTRRDAGRTFQPQNLPSRGLLPQHQTELGIKSLLSRSESLIFPDVMLLTTSTIRGTIIAPPGKKLVVSDLSNIEGRGLAWLAGESWKIEAFREFDEGHGPDLYKLAYAKSFRVDPSTVTKAGRSIGKVQELALGYAGGVNAFLTFALAYGMDLEEMADTAWDTLDPGLIEEVTSFLDWLEGKGTVYPMSRKAAIVCDSFKRLWREAHPNVVRMWADLENGFRESTQNPGITLTAGRFRIRRDGAWLRILLPSGRSLCYPHPKVADDGSLSFMGINQFNRKWQRIRTFSGKIAENVTQSFARDILFDATPSIETAGYRIVMKVHDEVITEAPDSPEFNSDHLSALLATPPEYALDMPLAAAGFEAYRYRKD